MFFVYFQAPNESTLRQLAEKLTEAGVDHKLWVEQPEDFPTCIAVKPYPKAEVQKHFKKLKLYKGPKLDVPKEAEKEIPK